MRLHFNTIIQKYSAKMAQQQRINYSGGGTSQSVIYMDNIEVVKSRMIHVNDAQSEFLANLSVSEDTSW